MLPDAPADAYCASGHNGKRVLVVIPSLGMVAAWNDSAVDRRTNVADTPTNRAMKTLA